MTLLKKKKKKIQIKQHNATLCITFHVRYLDFILCIPVFQLETEKGRAPGRTLCAKWAREGTF